MSTGPVVGETITFTVYGNLKNATGASFTLKFPADKLDYITATNLSGFAPAGASHFTVIRDSITNDPIAVRFNGTIPTTIPPTPPISGVNTPIFSVTFEVLADGALLDLDEPTGKFTRLPTTVGPSTNIYALKLIDTWVTTTT